MFAAIWMILVNLAQSPLFWGPALIATILIVLWVVDRILAFTINLNRFKEKS